MIETEVQFVKLRASGLPLLMKCASSQEKAQHPVHEVDTEPQNSGNAVHALLAEHVHGVEHDDAQIRAVCTEHHANPDDVSMLYAMGRKAWRKLWPYFQGGEIEADHADAWERESETTPRFVITGHPDVDGETCGADWKSGRIQSDACWQMQAYSWLCGWKHAAVAWLRFGEVEIEAYMGDEAFEAAVTEQITRIGKEYNPGDHCGLCQKQDECPARAKRLQTALAVVSGEATLDISRESLAAAYPMAAQLAKALESFYDAVTATVREGGPLDLGNGQEVYINEFEKEHLDPVKSWPVIASRYSEEQIASALRIGKTALQDMIKQSIRDEHGGKPPRGSLGRGVGEVWDELKAAGAISTTPKAQRATRKVKK